MSDEAALFLAENQGGPADPDELPFPWEEHYAAELANPEVQQMHAFFQGLDTYALHRSGVAAARGRKGGADGQWVYGDTGVPLMYRLLRRWGVGPQDQFFDLGCGCGIPVFAASLVAGRAVGVEVVPAALDFCNRAARALQRDNTEFRLQDLFEADIEPATFVYLACTTFPPEVRSRLAQKMLQTRRGTRIVTVTHHLQGKGLRHVVKLPQFFSWSGYGPGYTYEFHLHQRV